MDNLREKRLYRRFRIRLQIEIVVKSIGSKHPYSFKTGNISPGGVFVVSDNAKCPFLPQSILESTLYLESEQGSNERIELNFVGKVAHMKNKEGFGIKIVQIEPKDQQILNDYISKYADANPESLLK